MEAFTLISLVIVGPIAVGFIGQFLTICHRYRKARRAGLSCRRALSTANSWEG